MGTGIQRLEDYTHPILGVFERTQHTTPSQGTYVRLTKRGSTTIVSLGYEFPEFSISLREIVEPPAAMVADLVRLLHWPESRRHEIEERLLQHYASNRSRYVDEMRENGYSDQRIEKAAPPISEPASVRKLIVRPRYINAGTWPHVSVAFDTTYDAEHELHIAFQNDRVVRLWDE